MTQREHTILGHIKITYWTNFELFQTKLFIIFYILFQVFTLIGFFSIQIGDFSHNGNPQFYSTVVMICFWFTAILLVLYLFQVIYVFSRIPWSKIEFYFCLTATLFLMLVSSLIAATAAPSLTVAAVNFFFSEAFTWLELN